MMSCYQILDKHTIIDMYCPKCTSQSISHLPSICYCSEKSIIANNINDSICIAVWDPVIKIRQLGLTPPHFCVCPKPEPGFPTSHVVVFMCSVNSVKMRGDCSFCWYCRNWWPSLFKLSFHNIIDMFCLKCTLFSQNK